MQRETRVFFGQKFDREAVSMIDAYAAVGAQEIAEI